MRVATEDKTLEQMLEKSLLGLFEILADLPRCSLKGQKFFYETFKKAYKKLSKEDRKEFRSFWDLLCNNLFPEDEDFRKS